MSLRVAIRHHTEYRFDRLVRLSPHVVRLRPAPHTRTPIHSYALKVEPGEHFINWQQDVFGNYLARLVFTNKCRKLAVTVEVVAEMVTVNPFDFFVEEHAEYYPFRYGEALSKELQPYLEITDNGPRLQAWLAGVNRDRQTINDFLVSLNRRLHNDIAYTIRMEPGVQSCEQTLERARGSCRDSAWLLAQVLRHLGLASRFVSGYLVQLTPDVKALDGPSGPEQDFTDLHAWTEVYLPGAGWVGLDPTSGLLASEGHIPLACTPHPSSAAPIAGATDKCEVDFSFSNTVQRIHEDPRVTKPYSDDQWTCINALGDAVDSQLQAMDVRLTMGGEPTFVSIDDMDGPEWNTEALGRHKLRLAKELLLRLREQFAPQGALHYGQGKWYPGEELPRWALGCFWRADGEALWRDPQWLARVDRDYGHGLADAERFGGQLCRALQLEPGQLIPAYEDALYYLWKEQSLPADCDPLRAELDDPLERQRLARLLARGLNQASGFVLPLAWDDIGRRWRSSPWPLRREQLVLTPGDSPLGLRLPLDSLPATAEKPPPARDPFETQPPLSAAVAPLSAQLSKPHEQAVNPQRAQASQQPAAGETVAVIRTALCIEARDGKLHVFLPPLQQLEHYVLLVEAIERCAAELALPVVLEGYEPPRDNRLLRLQVTPDPGVIEVNIHPAHSWRELVATTETLYEQAHLCRLGTEKFMLDGRHTGTGGGNHVTLGGASPADSPLLRRPDLLRSLVCYWQHHPGLSYLFSSLFIGPTSQAPRVDEGRDEYLYELETAFREMPDGPVSQPWLVDRLLRNLLVDITGNTHRAEFCIDKLYSPDSPGGRQGLLEFRGFEMPPHPRMALVQLLLLRCLVARFWRSPYHKPLVRWGTALHDRFMLPHYVWADIREVVQDLNDAGLPFQLEWLAPFEEFRYPHFGRVQLGDISLELRWAIEPWHVLGEEISSFGTARYVDSSVERVQVKLCGLTDGRYVLACNGRRVPLQATGSKGEYVAGVRYKAWQPPSALHPTVGKHPPLVFDLIDSWNGLSIGGCRYHVTHPGGRHYERFPVNALEAESRRVNRFWHHGYNPEPLEPLPAFNAIREFFPDQHPPRPLAPPPEEPEHEYPYTLDLRRRPS